MAGAKQERLGARGRSLVVWAVALVVGMGSGAAQAALTNGPVADSVDHCDLREAWPGDLVLTSGAKADDPTSRDELPNRLLGRWTHVGLRSRHGVMLEQVGGPLRNHNGGLCPHYVTGGARASDFASFLHGTYNPNYYKANLVARRDGTTFNHRVVHVSTDQRAGLITPQQRRRAEGFAWMQIGEWPYHEWKGYTQRGSAGVLRDGGGDYALGWMGLSVPWEPQYCSGLAYWAWNLGTTGADPAADGFWTAPGERVGKGNDLGWRFRSHLLFARHAAYEVMNHSVGRGGVEFLCEPHQDQSRGSAKDLDDMWSWMAGQAFGWLRQDDFYSRTYWVRGDVEVQNAPSDYVLTGAEGRQRLEDFLTDLAEPGLTTYEVEDLYSEPRGCFSQGSCTRGPDDIKGFMPSDLVTMSQSYRFAEGIAFTEDYSDPFFEQPGLSSQSGGGGLRDAISWGALTNPANPQTCNPQSGPLFWAERRAYGYGFHTLATVDDREIVPFQDYSGTWGVSYRRYETPVYQVHTSTVTQPTTTGVRRTGNYANLDRQVAVIDLPYEANHITEVWVHYEADLEPGYDTVTLRLYDTKGNGPDVTEISASHTGPQIAKLQMRDRTNPSPYQGAAGLMVTFASDVSNPRDYWGFAITQIEIKVRDYREDLENPENGDICDACDPNPGDGICDPCALYCRLGECHPDHDPNCPAATELQDGEDCLPASKASGHVWDEYAHVANVFAKGPIEGIKYWLKYSYGDGNCDAENLIIMGDDGGDCVSFPNRASFHWPSFNRATSGEF